MTIKQRIFNDLQGSETDSNHITRRMFRCWLDGSYLGEEHYRQNIADLKKICDDGMKGFGIRLNSWVINQFTRYTAHDAQCSYGYAQKCIVEYFKATSENYTDPDMEELSGVLDYKHLLSVYTDDLAEDALDLIDDYYKEARAKWDAEWAERKAHKRKTKGKVIEITKAFSDLGKKYAALHGVRTDH